MGLELGLGKVTKQQKILIGIIGVAGFIYFYTSIFVPLGENIAEARRELREKRSEVVEMQVQAGLLENLEKEYRIFSEHLERTEEHLPRTEEIPEFIKTITDLAGRFDMDVKNLSVQEASSSDYYDIHPYRMNLQSDYHTLGRFFARLGQLERIFSIKDLSLRRDDGDLVSANFEVVAYTFRD